METLSWRLCWLVALAGVLSAHVALARPYADLSMFDNVNIDDVINDEEVYQRFLKCLLGTGECCPGGQALKEILPEALETECAKCTEEQKDKAAKIIKFLVSKKHDDFLALAKKYDPDGKLASKFLS